MKTLKIEIGDHDKIKSRNIVSKAAKRIIRDEPRIWYNDFAEFSLILSKTNLELLNQIRQLKPKSIEELAKKIGRRKCDVSRNLNAMKEHALVELRAVGDQIMPIVNYDNITATMVIGSL